MWERLTVDERREFHHLVQSGKLGHLVDVYTPWWEVSSFNHVVDAVVSSFYSYWIKPGDRLVHFKASKFKWEVSISIDVCCPNLRYDHWHLVWCWW